MIINQHVSSASSLFIFVLTIALICLGLPTQIAAQGTLVLGTSSGPPLSNATQNGFIDKVVSEALSRMGYRLKVSHLPAERALINANSGVDDGDLNRVGGLSKIYPNLIQVTEKTLTMEFVAFSKRRDVTTHNWNSLKNHSVGIINGWKILENNIPQGTEVIKVRDEEQLFLLLNNNRVDLILFSKWRGLKLISDTHYQGIHLLEPSLAKRDMYVYFNRKHTNLVPSFTSALRELKKDGRYDDIYNEVLLPISTRISRFEYSLSSDSAPRRN